MNDLIVWRDKLQELYAMKSIYIDKAVQFVLALVTFLMINQNIGLMKAVATPVVAVALAVICTFLPPVVTAYVAAGLVIVHLFKLSIGVAAAAALMLWILHFSSSAIRMFTAARALRTVQTVRDSCRAYMRVSGYRFREQCRIRRSAAKPFHTVRLSREI